ncbi:type VI secretion system baseplate subunit TssE [Enterovibrio sp. ZSDZ35]|uniref:Type VI secretion system baseplate subunit TssE n=1 Tax=Enterovibrio qingdaonensis TaxID=2899818 RepID=A0ABT5QTE7_9GAMM|nr:type VI secretion system baseplate subunit TssE [Enterovibrio sp. ZSDZ35]MDD1783978.1 type VI secretion system baseplate subunit TssE [Enterovibrio sp. ZSDZ35]
MSLTMKLRQAWRDDLDDVREDIVSHIASLISGRAPIWVGNEDPSQLSGTIVTMGMQNIARSQSKANSDVVGEEIRQLIKTFEPRLSAVELEVNEESTSNNQLEFRITAVMHSEYGDETVVFDSFLDFSTSKLDVRKTNLV